MADIESPDVQFDGRGLESRLRAVLESRYAWLLAVAIFSLISLLPFWAQRFPPLQDYPQLLLQVHMLETRGDPAYDYDQYYEFDLRPGPYATFYYVTLLLSKFLPIELAGKMFLTLYIGLIALLVLKGARHCRGGRGEPVQPRGPPWGLLLLFPFAFNQNYFLGTINYFFSIPLLGLILLDFEDYASARRGIWPAARHTLWQGALFLTHPFTFLLYLGFAGLRTILNYARGRRAWRLAASLLAGSAAFAVWYFLERGSSAADGSPLDQPWVYKPLMWSVGFFSSMFTGMRWNGGIDLAATLLWLVVFVLLAGAVLSIPERRMAARNKYLLGFLLTAIGVFAVPFAKGDYSFINLRLSAVAYLFLAFWAGSMRLRGIRGFLFIFAVAACLISSVLQQARISRDVEEIVPLVEKIPPNASLLRLVFPPIGSPHLDPLFFDTHLHDHNYYHLIVGGGYSPYLWNLHLFPVRYKAEAIRPAPPQYEAHRFTWQDHGEHYDYFLVRGAPALFHRYMGRFADWMGQSGAWILLKKKDGGAEQNEKEQEEITGGSAEAP